MARTGMIHGRFQPFHIGHFDYLIQALDKVGELIIGITNPDPHVVHEVSSDSHRHLPDANPFSYYLRMQMIRKSILANNDLCKRFSDIMIVPFPINAPELWKYYVPAQGVVQLMRILDPWDIQKRDMFCQHGFDVIVLKGKRLASGTEIRWSILSGNEDWHQKVPLGTVEVLEQWIGERGG